MRVILDECLPRRLGMELSGHLVSTVPQAGWAGLANGTLLARIQGNHEAFITVDKRLTDAEKIVEFTGANLVFEGILLGIPKTSRSSKSDCCQLAWFVSRSDLWG